MASLCATGIARKRILSPATRSVPVSAGRRSTFARRSDVLFCSSSRIISNPDDVVGGDDGTHSRVLTATQRRYRRRPWEDRACQTECRIIDANNLRRGFAPIVPGGIGGTYRTLGTVATGPSPVVDERKSEDEHQNDEKEECDSEDEGEDADEESSDSIYKILTGRPQEDPSDYVEEGRKKYVLPKTLEGWKTFVRDVWTTYYNTFQGWETEEERIEREREERRTKGLPVDDADGEDETETVYEIEYDEDALRRKQKDITDNVGRNLNIAHSTGQDLLEKAKEKTGIRTKEDLKIWAGEQMKLATACLSEFMGGYREGRDEEVDRMLNEYFKDLDENDEEEKSGNDNTREIKSPGSTPAEKGEDCTDDDEDEDGDADTQPSEKKAGRRRRKRRP